MRCAACVWPSHNSRGQRRLVGRQERQFFAVGEGAFDPSLAHRCLLPFRRTDRRCRSRVLAAAVGRQWWKPLEPADEQLGTVAVGQRLLGASPQCRLHRPVGIGVDEAGNFRERHDGVGRSGFHPGHQLADHRVARLMGKGFGARPIPPVGSQNRGGGPAPRCHWRDLAAVYGERTLRGRRTRDGCHPEQHADNGEMTNVQSPLSPRHTALRCLWEQSVPPPSWQTLPREGTHNHRGEQASGTGSAGIAYDPCNPWYRGYGPDRLGGEFKWRG